MRIVGLLVLIVGYPLALVGIFRLRSALRDRDVTWFAVATGGAAAIAVGWALRGRTAGVITNGAWTAVLLLTWWWTGRRR